MSAVENAHFSSDLFCTQGGASGDGDVVLAADAVIEKQGRYYITPFAVISLCVCAKSNTNRVFFFVSLFFLIDLFPFFFTAKYYITNEKQKNGSRNVKWNR